MSDWLRELTAVNKNGRAAALITVADVRGSAPREIGAKMIAGNVGCKIGPPAERA